MSHIANVIGATGLVGSHLVDLLLRDPRCSTVRIFVRRSANATHDKLEEHIIDFGDPASWQAQVTGDMLFSTLGTTHKKAGSKEAQYRVDHAYQYQFARAASDNGVKSYILCSSAGATPDSWIFYLRMKGELERDIKQLHFDHISIVKPGQIAGDRREFRAGEQFLIRMMRAVTAINVFRKYRPIDARKIARAMINCGFNPGGPLNVLSLNEVHDAAEAYAPPPNTSSTPPV